MTSIKEWIEIKIKTGYIHYFEYDKFSQITEIDRGGFGKVNKANLANAGLVALKIFFNNNSNIEEDELNEVNKRFIKELRLLREVDYHQNINRILGITKDSEYYILVLEYANEGNLRDYLKKNFASLKWNNKSQMALDITSGLKFLHSKEIIHRDLHSKNILVKNGKLLIADFGLSKKLADITSNSMGNNCGVIEYIEPQCFKSIKYKKDKKSDIYSLGVLLWEISSGRPPFSGCERNLLKDHIKDGNREEPTEGTPLKYQQLYQKCWDGEPKSRPDIEEVYEILKTSFDLQSPYLNMPNEDKSSKTDDDDLTIPSNYQNLNSRITSSDTTKLNSKLNENGEPKSNLDMEKVNETLNQLKTGSFEQQSSHLNIPNNDNRSNSQYLNSRNNTTFNNQLDEKKKKGNPRNLLIIGHAGSGKSTLSNVLSNTDDFEESKCSKNFRKQIFEWKGIKYHVVDDIGMALTNKKVMYEKMPEVNYLMPEGVSQILFVIDGKFTAEEESTFNLLEDSIFGNDISEYITIVRTKFSNFKNERECKKDKDDLYNENETVAKLCKSIVHIDNPPINIFVHDEDDKETIIVNGRRRDQSRTILLDYLNKVISEKYYDKIFVGNIAGPIGDTLNFKNYNDQTINLARMNRSVRMKSKKLNRSINLENPKFNLEVGIRNLLIVGRANSGKSTLAEVLSDSHYYAGKIEKKYNVIDIEVTKPIKNIIKISEKIKEICQILFVIDGKITADAVEAIFDNDIHEHITIVRTKFSNFKNEDKCKKDKEDLCKQNEAVAKIRQNIVYVDNPPININVKDKDDEATITLSKKRRDWSKTILLDHLNKVFQEKGDELCNEIAIESITEELKRNLKPEIPEEIGRDNYILKFFTDMTKTLIKIFIN
ncbi:kinase-like domain-containing protein [Rhizophagus diaphanus]|nr:kinase-like domain-containing protein [Rhizophagus diaphanus] [Rhizophagus sp. MUCL 43196]